MIRAAKVRAIARFEFVTVARRPGFLLVTFGLPLFFAGIAGALGTVQTSYFVRSMERLGFVGLVDEAGVLDDNVWTTSDELSDDARAAALDHGFGDMPMRQFGKDVFVRLESVEDARRLVGTETLEDGAYVLEENYLEGGAVTHYAPDETGAMGAARRSAIEPSMARLLRDRMLRDRIDDSLRERVLAPMEVTRVVVAAGGAERSGERRGLETLFRVGVPFFLGVFLLTALLFSSGYLVQTVALDKESKIVEVLLSSAEPDEILTGKLLGLGAAGLIQFFVWSSMIVLAAAVFAQRLIALDIELPWAALGLSPVLFVLGYLFFGSLMLSTGSVGSGIAESQKLTMGWAMLAISPLFVLLLLIESPHGPLALFLTAIPFTSPLVLIVRLSVEPAGVGWVDILVSITSLVAATWLALRIGSRLFRIGLLLSGSRPSWRELWRQARLSD
ncbi:MAG: ABC transporter permease [Myxococcota bacterium]